MDKLTINNELVAMRKAVRQARVHTIRKLVREAKILKEKKLKTSDTKIIEKFQHKAQKLGDDIIAIKKLQDDYVSKHALTSESNHVKELSNPNSTAEARAIARLCLHKSITQRVLDFKAKFSSLDKSIEDMLAVGKRKQKKMQHIQAKKEDKQRKEEIKSEEMKRVEWLKNNTIPNLKENEIIENKTTEESNHITNSNEKGLNKDHSGTRIKKKSGTISDIVKNDDEIDINQKGTVNTKRRRSNMCSKEDDFEQENDYSDGNQEIEYYSDEEKNSLKYEPPNKKIKTSTEKTIDSFFITDSGDNYLSTYVPKVTNDTVIDIEDGFNRRERRAQKFGNVLKSKRSAFGKSKNIRNFSNIVENNYNTNRTKKPCMGNDKLNKEQNQSQSFNARGSVSSNDFQQKQMPATNEKLHPSWEAKKAPQIVAFQGKKITFDD